MHKSFKLILIIAVIIAILQIEATARTKTAPETVLVRVLTPNNLPDANALCKADIYKEEILIEQGKKLRMIPSMAEYIDIRKWDLPTDKGYYELETDLKDYKGQFKIIVNCFLPDYNSTGIVIMNNTHIPCELRERKYLIC